MFKLLFILFLLVPLLEIYVLIEVGSHIGAVATVGLVMFTAVVGVFLLRLQGLVTVSKVKQTLDQGSLPAVELIEGLLLLIAGALLLTPGFFTDCLGFLLLAPWLRAFVASHILMSLIELHKQQHPEQPQVLEGEYWEEDQK